MEWASVAAGSDLGVGGACLGEGVVSGEGDDAAELGVEAVDAGEVDLGEAFGGELAGLDPAREMSDGGVGDGFVGAGEWAGVELSADEFVGGRELGFAGEDGVPVSGAAPWPRSTNAAPAPVKRGHGAAP